MIRREFLKGMGALLIALNMPLPKLDQKFSEGVPRFAELLQDQLQSAFNKHYAQSPPRLINLFENH